jgi:hypothetical protein
MYSESWLRFELHTVPVAKNPARVIGGGGSATSACTICRDPLGVIASAVIKYTGLSFATTLQPEVLVTTGDINTSLAPFQHTPVFASPVELTE